MPLVPIFSDFFDFRWKYLLSDAIFQILRLNPFSKNRFVHELVFVCDEGDKGWILEAICLKLKAKITNLPTKIVYSKNYKNLPKARYYYFAHQKYFAKALRYNPHLRFAENLVSITHIAEGSSISLAHFRFLVNRAKAGICLNSDMKDQLSSQGINLEKLVIYHLGCEPNDIQAHERGRGKIAFNMFYSARKNPDMVLALVKAMPERSFLMLGRHWQKYPHFQELTALPNFEYREDPYELYPEHYATIDVFIAPSFLEGGPVPVLEALLANAIPVASRTGFCPDVIEHGVNGYLFDPYDSVDVVKELVHRALQHQGDVRPSVLHCSWQRYAESIEQLLLA